jgi:hypothetical protein
MGCLAAAVALVNFVLEGHMSDIMYNDGRGESTEKQTYMT